MIIRDLQQAIEAGLENLTKTEIPAEIGGLRNLPVGGYRPRVSIYYTDANGTESRQKLHENADVSHFDPEVCEVVIGFAPITDMESDDRIREVSRATLSDTLDESEIESAINHLVGVLRSAEGVRRFVGLEWFRDRRLPDDSDPALAWTRDPEVASMALSRALGYGVIHTMRMPSPKSPYRPVTVIQLNRGHPWLDGEFRFTIRKFKPIRIRGGMISDTVIEDREDRI